MPTLSILDPNDGSNGKSLGSVSVKVLLHPEPFRARGDGIPAPEHTISRWTEPMVQCFRSAPQQANCYIEVQANTYFAFEFSISDRSVVTSDGLKFAIFLDDHYVDYVFMEMKDCQIKPSTDGTGLSVVWKRGVARCGRSNSKQKWYENCFYFQPIRFVKEVADLGMAMRQNKRAAGMGNLRIEVYRISKGPRALFRAEVSENTIDYNDHFLTQDLAVHPDFLNGRSATLSATLKDRMESSQIDVGRGFIPTDGAFKPVAIFHFEYRTAETLTRLGYQPSKLRLPAPSAPHKKQVKLVSDPNSVFSRAQPGNPSSKPVAEPKSKSKKAKPVKPVKPAKPHDGQLGNLLANGRPAAGNQAKSNTKKRPRPTSPPRRPINGVTGPIGSRRQLNTSGRKGPKRIRFE